jgi:CTP:phosphocholine cytidylyltransferase-like protein
MNSISAKVLEEEILPFGDYYWHNITKSNTRKFRIAVEESETAIRGVSIVETPSSQSCD